MSKNQSIKEAGTVTLERTYNAPAQRVWEALTDVNKLRKWYFNLSGFELRVGYKFEFAGESDCAQYIHFSEITEVVEGKKLTYTWSYKGYEGMSYVTWELFPERDKTKVVLTHVGLESFPKHPDFSKDSFTGGWTYFLGTALKDFVENE